MATSKLIRVKDEDISLKHDNDITTFEACDSTDIKENRDGILAYFVNQG